MKELTVSIKNALENAYVPVIINNNGVEGGIEVEVQETRLGSTSEQFKGAASLASLSHILGNIIEKLFRFKELREVADKYNEFLGDIENDYNAYTTNHEDYLNHSIDAIANINTNKAVMKHYLLEELYVSLQKCGLDGAFTEMSSEMLDLRKWPINEKYNLREQKHLEIKEQLSLGNLAVFVKLLVEDGVRVSAVYAAVNIFSIRKKIKGIKEEIEFLEPMVRDNNAGMAADLNQLYLLNLALNNIARIYNDILKTVRPVMKGILQDLELNHGCNVDDLPNDQKEALFYISRLLKELAEKQIVQNDKSTIHKDVCDYSDDMSRKYNEIKSELNKFC